MPSISTASFTRAVNNIARWGDTDVFPFPFENHVFFDEPEKVVAALKTINDSAPNSISDASVERHSTLAPVGYTGFRWATQIDPLWNAYLLSAVLELAPLIERSRVDESQGRVFSYRFREEPNEGLFAADGWQRFQGRARELAEASNYVVVTDIADFYARIYHHRLENALHSVDPHKVLSKQVMALLKSLSNGTSYGLPVGGPAARILSELLLNRVDRLLFTESTTRNFIRYADDYRFFVDDLPAAYRAIGYLSEKLHRNEGLALQKNKTRIMTSREYLAMLDPVQAPPGTAAKFLGLRIHYDPYSLTAREDFARLSEQLQEFDILDLLQTELAKTRVHSALTRRLVAAIKYLDTSVRKAALLSLLENLDPLAPVLPQVFLSMRDSLEGLITDEREEIQSKIRALIRARHHSTEVELNLSYMIRILAEDHTTENEQLLLEIYAQPHGYSGGTSPLIQRDIMITMARWNVQYWLSDQKTHADTMHHWVQRAFWVASYALGDEGQHWRQAHKSSLSEYDQAVRAWAGDRWQRSNWRLPL